MPRSLVDCEIGGEVAQAAANLGCSHADFLLGSGDNAGAFLAERSLDALFIFEAVLFYLVAKFLHLLAKAGELGLDSAQAGLRVGSGCARGFKVLAQGLGALANDLGHDPGKRDGDGEKDDGKVNAEQKEDGCIEVEMQNAGEGLHHGRMQEGLLLLCLGFCGAGAELEVPRRAGGG